MSADPLTKLQSRYIAGDPLSNEEASQLLRWLNDHPDERREMLLEEAIENQLRCLARLNDEESSETFILETVGRAVASRHRDDGPPVVRIVEQDRPRSYKLFSVRAGLCAAAIVLIGTAITWYSLKGPNRADFGFAKITHAENLTWELLDEGRRRLRVSSGSGEVHFNNGTIAQLSAPAVIELQSLGNMFIESGSVRISVPPAAVGFTVETPIARIVDYGTKFDVAVDETGKTNTRVRSGTVTFEAHPTRRNPKDPIKLTAAGLNRASATTSKLTDDIRSVTTTASGAQGQFYGTIHADGETMEFTTRREFVDFLSRLHSSIPQNPSQFHQHWQVMVETTGNSTSTSVESSSGSGILSGSATDTAHQMLIEQLRAMQGIHQGNPQMQQVLEGMLLQMEQVNGKNFDEFE